MERTHEKREHLFPQKKIDQPIENGPPQNPMLIEQTRLSSHTIDALQTRETPEPLPDQEEAHTCVGDDKCSDGGNHVCVQCAMAGIVGPDHALELLCEVCCATSELGNLIDDLFQ